MTRFYFYAADLYYYEAAGGSPPSRIGDYEGVLEIDGVSPVARRKADVK